MARIKIKEGENLTKSNIEKVIDLLEDVKPITKKTACDILNIAYNTTRLNNIIIQFQEEKIYTAKMRKKMRVTPLDVNTCSQIVSSYMSGSSLVDISNETYRSTTVIKNTLLKYNIPVRNTSVDYFNPVFIESDVQDYKIGDLVYSARYDKPATISSVRDDSYGMWLHGEHRKHVYQPYYELADLRSVQNDLNITMYDMDSTEVKTIMYEAMKKQKTQEDKRK